MEDNIQSISDRRIENNTMRHQYRTLTLTEQTEIQQVKDAGQYFFDLCGEMGPNREILLAQRKIEEAVMWAVKHITK